MKHEEIAPWTFKGRIFCTVCASPLTEPKSTEIAVRFDASTAVPFYAVYKHCPFYRDWAGYSYDREHDYIYAVGIKQDLEEYGYTFSVR